MYLVFLHILMCKKHSFFIKKTLKTAILVHFSISVSILY